MGFEEISTGRTPKVVIPLTEKGEDVSTKANISNLCYGELTDLGAEIPNKNSFVAKLNACMNKDDGKGQFTQEDIGELLGHEFKGKVNLFTAFLNNEKTLTAVNNGDETVPLKKSCDGEKAYEFLCYLSGYTQGKRNIKRNPAISIKSVMNAPTVLKSWLVSPDVQEFLTDHRDDFLSNSQWMGNERFGFSNIRYAASNVAVDGRKLTEKETTRLENDLLLDIFYNKILESSDHKKMAATVALLNGVDLLEASLKEKELETLLTQVFKENNYDEEAWSTFLEGAKNAKESGSLPLQQPPAYSQKTC